MVTKMITMKLDDKFLKDIDKAVKKGNYQNRTEFIRASLRKNLDEEKMREAMASIAHLRGASKTKITDEEYERIRKTSVDGLEKWTSEKRLWFERL